MRVSVKKFFACMACFEVQASCFFFSGMLRAPIFQLLCVALSLRTTVPLSCPLRYVAGKTSRMVVCEVVSIGLELELLNLSFQVSTSSDTRSAQEEEMPQSSKVRGLRRSGPAGLRRHKRRWSSQQATRNQLLPLQSSRTSQEESTPFVLDLQNLPGLASVNLSAQNPNIQVGMQGYMLLTDARPLEQKQEVTQLDYANKITWVESILGCVHLL